jgi:5-methylcytosine-specific restriction protein A
MRQTNWLKSMDSEAYNHAAAFEKYGYIDWKHDRHTKAIQVGDRVFIRSRETETNIGEIEYIGIVEKTNIPFEEATDDSEFWKDSKKPVNDRYFRIRLVGCTRGMGVTREAMIAHGLNENNKLQGSWRLSSLGTDVEDFILDSLIRTEDEIFDVREMDGYPEGAKMTVVVNRYERDPRNRRACIDHYGCRCQACGMDFGETYGPLAEGFIHVHHRKPVSEMGEDYVVDPVKDLIPLCSNCHVMVHHLGVTPEMLKRIIRPEVERRGC